MWLACQTFGCGVAANIIDILVCKMHSIWLKPRGSHSPSGYRARYVQSRPRENSAGIRSPRDMADEEFSLAYCFYWEGNASTSRVFEGSELLGRFFETRGTLCGEDTMTRFVYRIPKNWLSSHRRVPSISNLLTF